MEWKFFSGKVAPGQTNKIIRKEIEIGYSLERCCEQKHQLVNITFSVHSNDRY